MLYVHWDTIYIESHTSLTHTHIHVHVHCQKKTMCLISKADLTIVSPKYREKKECIRIFYWLVNLWPFSQSASIHATHITRFHSIKYAFIMHLLINNKKNYWHRARLNLQMYQMLRPSCAGSKIHRVCTISLSHLCTGWTIHTKQHLDFGMDFSIALANSFSSFCEIIFFLSDKTGST